MLVVLIIEYKEYCFYYVGQSQIIVLCKTCTQEIIGATWEKHNISILVLYFKTYRACLKLFPKPISWQTYNTYASR